ncbi:hypothetical protein ARGLB_035_00070 [Arthrobacter globiformis NBRC 12137]|uniref:Uncharacterized protein n=1 Tax=Arthrobacter globiformis (strain ATCC 8010 / DSM 20124 / JCM 1332 / NBRC 12137 / NCIMB 8907 / NRRL B-2979 / 168) TaxID=1077972 RepID=H0QJP2_ARTG1|nr:hypothetical protein ARGLB_035_00070 [Arthrobacter globiformis NBRC 12137]
MEVNRITGTTSTKSILKDYRMMSIMFRGAANRMGGPASTETQKLASGTSGAVRPPLPMADTTSPAAREHLRSAAYDAVERVLNGLLQPLNARTLTTRWNEALNAMAKHLETRCTS